MNQTGRIWKRIFYVIVFMAIETLLAFNIFTISPVQSEDAHLASGVSHWKFGSFDLYRVNPPLVRMMATFPIAHFCEDHTSWKNRSLYPLLRKEFQVGQDYLRETGAQSARYFKIARIACFVFATIGLVSGFVLTKRFYGNAAALIALLICGGSPYFLGHAATIMPDAHAASMAVLAFFCYTKWLKDPNFYHLFLAGLTLGLAELTKFTLLLFYPLFVILWGLYCIPQKWERGNSADESAQMAKRSISREVFQLILIFALSLLVINMGYFFEGTGKQLRSFQFQTTLFSGCQRLEEVPGGGNRFDGSGNFLETAIGYLPMPLPKNFIQGIDTQRLDFERGLPSYLRGEWSERGWWYYYLYALFIKTPLGTILLFLLSIVCAIFLKGYNNGWRDEMLILVPAVALFVFVSSQTGFSVHSRYMLPALPFFLIWMSKLGRAFTSEMNAISPKSSRIVRWLTVIFLVGSLGSSLWVYPHSIAYFNGFAAILPTPRVDPYPPPQEESFSVSQKIRHFLDSGPLNGPRHLLDSNLDWGQDLFELERWCKNHPEIHEIKTALWNSYPEELTTIPTTGKPPLSNRSNDNPLAQTPSRILSSGWYAVSVNDLYGKEQEYREFFRLRPVAIIGYTVYLYHIPSESSSSSQERADF